MTITRTLDVTGPADLDTVWARYAVPSLWTSWAPHLTTVDASTASIEPGTTGRLTALRLVPARFTITHVDPARRQWDWTVTSLGMTLDLVHTVDAAPHGTRATLAVTGPTVLVTCYLPVARWALHRLVAT